MYAPMEGGCVCITRNMQYAMSETRPKLEETLPSWPPTSFPPASTLQPRSAMPRLLFGSLPADLTTAGLTELLANPPKGISAPAALDHTTPRPTDVKVLLNQLGRSRRMAFVGYKSQEQAAWIKDVWEGTWVDGRAGGGTGSRVSVEWAKGIEPSTKTRASAQNDPSTSSSPADYPPKKKTKLEAAEKPQDSQFAEFMSLSHPRKNKSLVHEIMELSIPQQPTTNAAAPPQPEPEDPPTENQPPLDGSSSSRSSSPPPVIGDDEDITDKEYLARRMKRKLADTVDLQPDPKEPSSESKEWDQEEEDLAENGDQKAAPDDQQQSKKPHDGSKPPEPAVASDETTILESGRLFLRNLAFSVTEEEIRALFEPFGNVAQVHILLDHERKPKGLGYVSFSRSSDALEAYRKLDQSDFQGRLLHILPAVTRNSRADPASKPHNSVKMEQDAKRKLESSKQFNWATLYMNSDAVASSVADRLKITKAELFNPDAQNPAVKLALAETHVINETKQFLEDSGIDVEAFEKLKSARSPTTILVKNIPYNTSTTVVKALFSEHGSVLKVLMPPSGTIAVVEMGDKEDARSAFRSLAYKRIGNSVLYLEKAPLDLWKIDPAQPDSAVVVVKESKPSKAEAEEAVGEPGSTLFVKNLSFGTSSEALASRFSSLPGYLFARIQTKPDPKNAGGPRLSMGFGFVGFRTVEAAQQGLQRMQGCCLDGHSLALKFAKQGREEEEEEEEKKGELAGGKKSKTTSKLMIKNLPFEISRKELSELFGVYGKLKSVRLPKKLDRKSRGFGFVEFHTKKEAAEALKSLRFSHLLGRHLVIEYAHDEADAKALDLHRLRADQSALLTLQTPTPYQKKKFVGLHPTDAGEDGQDVPEFLVG
ncbi:hypothetical protein PTTG_08622 [Puccinia triticina 1-1 BBBD Race 1]|uniref:RRM domain-containing protein n=1 Tax=Puccinia triticina (isolate 1-1 / race 1 (BBBD)) TaxID=630390 RepID=A0A180G4U8_PUCT1|nr:hypothetical protein PTTG_08622 [Puccinia triticina 1-1 BBBD Race 1]WAR59587.1 hypothetical protein PtB15_11B227 [Puccinia triticina]